MKFCTKCGQELVDEAVICMGCGCMVAGAAPKKTEPTTENTPERPSILPSVFNFIFTIATVLCLFFLILGVAFPYAYVSEWSGDTYIYPNIGFAVFAWLLSLPSLGFGVVSFVISLVKRLGTEKVLGAVARFVIGIFLSILCFIVFIGSAV